MKKYYLVYFLSAALAMGVLWNCTGKKETPNSANTINTSGEIKPTPSLNQESKKSESKELKTARQLGETALQDHLITCEGNWYIQNSSGQLFQLSKEGEKFLIEEPVSEADKLNGYEFRSSFGFKSSGPYRIFGYPMLNQWGEWTSGQGHNVLFEINKINGEWKVIFYVQSYGGRGYIPPPERLTCENMYSPRKSSSPVKF